MPEIKEILHGCNAIELEIQIGLYCWPKKNFLRDCKTNKKRTGGPHNEKSRFFVYFFFWLVRSISLTCRTPYILWYEANELDWTHSLSHSCVHLNNGHIFCPRLSYTLMVSAYTQSHILDPHLIGTKTIPFIFFRVISLSVAAYL